MDDADISTAMQKRQLGKSNLEVSAIGFGCMGLNSGYGHPRSKEDAEALFAAKHGRARPSRSILN